MPPGCRRAPAFAAAQFVCPAWPESPFTELTLTTLPIPRSRIPSIRSRHLLTVDIDDLVLVPPVASAKRPSATAAAALVSAGKGFFLGPTTGIRRGSLLLGIREGR